MEFVILILALLSHQVSPTISLKEHLSREKVEVQYQQKSGCVEKEHIPKTSFQGCSLYNTKVIL